MEYLLAKLLDVGLEVTFSRVPEGILADIEGTSASVTAVGDMPRDALDAAAAEAAADQWARWLHESE